MGPVHQPDTSTLLRPSIADPSVTEDERKVVTEMMAKGTYGWALLATKNLDAVFELVAVSGAEVVSEPTDQPYGMLDCAFRDPAGNTVRIQQLS